MEKERSKITVAKIAKFLLIVFVALIVGGTVFFVFKINIEAKSALREAKNIRLALRTTDIEMYAQGRTIFNASRKRGLEEGVKEKVDQIAEPQGIYSITSYDRRNHVLTGMTYKVGHYIVTFDKDEKSTRWDVDYLMNIYSLDEDDVIISGE